MKKQEEQQLLERKFIKHETMSLFIQLPAKDREEIVSAAINLRNAIDYPIPHEDMRPGQLLLEKEKEVFVNFLLKIEYV